MKVNKKLKKRRLIDDVVLTVKIVPFLFIAACMFFMWILPMWEDFLDNVIPKSPLQLKVEALENENEEKSIYLNDLQNSVQDRDFKIEKLHNDNKAILQSDIERTKLDYSKLQDVKIYIADLIIREWERQGGTDDLVPLTICMYESKYNPLTRNTNGENSWGLFQVNVGDPAHAKRMQYTDYARLYEPLFNIRYQFPELITYEKKGISNGLKGYELAQYVARYGQRPRWSNALANQIKTYYQDFENAVIGGDLQC